MDLSGIEHFLTADIAKLLIIVTGVVILTKARKHDHSGSLGILGVLGLGLLVIGAAGFAAPLSAWAFGLFFHAAAAAPTP